MKAIKSIIPALIFAGLLFGACSKNSESTSVDTATFESSFKTAEPATQSSAQKAVSAAKSGDYATALSELKTLAGNAKLTPEQQQSLKDLMAKVQQALTKTAGDVQSGASKAATDLQKSLPK